MFTVTYVAGIAFLMDSFSRDAGEYSSEGLCKPSTLIMALGGGDRPGNYKI